MDTYKEMMERHQAEIHAFPFGYAIDNASYEKMMAAWGLSMDDVEQTKSFGGGIYYRASDEKAMMAMFERHLKEVRAGIDADRTGMGFVKEMFLHELDNHSGSKPATLKALKITEEELLNTSKLNRGYEEARKMIRRRCRNG